MKITLRNGYRQAHESGYGRINAALGKLIGSVDDMSADVHVFASPPYSFCCVDQHPGSSGCRLHDRDAPHVLRGPFNVGLTMCDKELSHYTNFDFVGLCNEMELILVPSQADVEHFRRGGVKAPLRQVQLGHDHAEWFAPIRKRPNRKVFILDRGRDYPEAVKICKQVFGSRNVDYYRRSGQGTLSRSELKQRYTRADIFVKWAEELGWSFPALEAMSAGCLLVTNCPYEFARPNVNCLSFSSGNELSQVLRHLKQETRYDVQARGQELALGLTWDLAYRQILAAIREAYAAKTS